MLDTLTEHIDIWTSSQIKKTSVGRGTSKKQEAYGIKKLRELILELAVRGKLVPQDPNDEPASDLLKKIQKEKEKLIKAGKTKTNKTLPGITNEEKTSNLPLTWEWCRFGKLAMHNSGKTLDKGRNSGMLRPYITTSNLYWGKFYLADLREMPIEDTELEKCTATKNDLLICEGGEAGRAAVWVEDYDICFQNHIHRARFLGGIDPFYTQLFLQKLSMSGEIEQHRKGVGISNMSSKALALIVVPLPPLAEQKRIVEKVDELMALCDRFEQEQESNLETHQALVSTLLNILTNSKNNQEFQETWQRIADCFDLLFTTEESIDDLKQTILQLAVMGKLVPQDPNDEPASELLKKIQKEKEKLIKAGKIKKQKTLLEVTEEEIPHTIPNNWIWARLESLYYSISPSGKKLKTSEFNEKGEYPVVDQGQSYVAGYTDEASLVIEIPGPVIVFGDHTTERKYIDFNFVPGADGTKILRPYKMDERYFFLYLTSYSLENRGYARHFKVLNANLIAVPPLQEQKRIVAKVDELMALCDSLKENIKKSEATKTHLTDAIVKRAVSAEGV